MLNMLTDFLTMEKLDQDKTDVQDDAFHLPAFIQEITEDMEGALKKGQHIRYTHFGDTNIHQDSRILRNVLLNLISNACKYSAENKPVDVITQVHDGLITLQVTDYGMGIPQADQPYIFNNFFRAKNAANIPGTGLGLNIVKRYMELLQGSINFTSAENEGTTFTLQFKSTK
jgi:signal transduction histidine kinase